ncbi:MAG TPA: 3D domain-containing protein [Phycisphaerales bacterium]|nr:3D domain-containing protein [Phycisphaerales bacterium]
MQRTDRSSRKLHRPSFFAGGEPLVFAAVLLVGAASAVVIKEFTSRSTGPALVAIDDINTSAAPKAAPDRLKIADPLVERTEVAIGPAPSAPQIPSAAEPQHDLSVRWFNGRPVRPAKTISMLVTAYSPDEHSCPGTADGITSSLHHVSTNAHKMVAADSRILPLGSMITIPGYDSGQVVPVLDRGGKIKGNRLDVLFPTHAEALKWGVRRVQVTVWEYADGQGAENWRAIRDSRN